MWRDRRPHNIRKFITQEVVTYVKDDIINFWFDKESTDFYWKVISPHNAARMIEQFWGDYN